jgi:hypothetical protein
MAEIGDINIIFLCNVQNGLAGSKMIDVTIDGNAVLIHGEPFLNFYFPVIPFSGDKQSCRMYHSPWMLSITRHGSLLAQRMDQSGGSPECFDHFLFL